MQQDDPRDEETRAGGEQAPEPVPVVMHGGLRIPRLGIRGGQEPSEEMVTHRE